MRLLLSCVRSYALTRMTLEYQSQQSRWYVHHPAEAARRALWASLRSNSSNRIVNGLSAV